MRIRMKMKEINVEHYKCDVNIAGDGPYKYVIK